MTKPRRDLPGKVLIAIIGTAVLILSFLLYGCDTPKHIQKMQRLYCPTVSDKVTDSITKKVERHDSLIYITTPPQVIKIASPCDSAKLKQFDVKQTKNGIHEEIKTVGNDLVFECNDDSLKKVIEGLNIVISSSRFEKQVKTIAPICTQEHTTDFQRFCVKLFWCVMGLILIALIIFVLKVWKKIP